MKKTTLYLPDDLKRAVGRIAKARACSEANVVREALRMLARQTLVRPTLPLFESGKPDLAERADELLAGFGERCCRKSRVARTNSRPSVLQTSLKLVR